MGLQEEWYLGERRACWLALHVVCVLVLKLYRFLLFNVFFHIFLILLVDEKCFTWFYSLHW